MKANLVVCLLLMALPVRAGEITGRVTLNDKPVAGVTVSALPVEQPAEAARREARREPRPAAIAKALTNAKGEFRLVFEAVAGETGKLVSLACAGGGVASAWLPGRFDTADVDDAGEFAARKGVPLGGRVVDVEGRPLADVEVEHPGGPGSVRTGADGRFAFEGVAEASSDVFAEKPGFVRARASNVRGGAKDVAIVMRPGLPLAGVVLAADGTTPVAGAIVRVDGREAWAAAETDAEGRFTVAAFAAGRVTVLADGGERGMREVTGVALPRPEGEPLKVILAPAPTARGRVIDALTRKPVAGAVLDVSAGRLRFWTRSGPDGTFTVRPAPASDFRIAASAPRYVTSMRTVARGEASRPIEILVRPAASVAGKVVDDQRRPLAGVKVRAYDASPRPVMGASSSVLTGDDGSFTLRRLASAETLRVLASHPDFETLSVGDLGLKPGEARAGLSLSLRRGAVITGVVSAGEAPLAGASVSLSPGRAAYGVPPRSLSAPQWSWPRTATGPDGRFRLGGLAPGDYTVSVSRVGYASETREAAVAEGKGPDPLSIVLGSEAVIAGSVRGKKGSGVPGQSVNATAVDAAVRSNGFARTLPDGSFRIDGLKAGVPYNLFMYSSSSNAPKKTVTAPADGVEILATGTGRIEGRVVDPEGRPVPEYQVRAQGDQSSGGPNWWANSVRQDVSAETGEFAIENASAGALEVRVVAKGYQAARVGGLVVEEGETRSGVEVRLARGAVVRGRVVEARSGRPVPEAEVSADSAPARVTSDSDGAFELEGVMPGKVRVTATSPEFTAASETIEVGDAGGTVELKLSPGGTISAVVVSAGGEPVAGAEVTLVQAGQNSYGGSKSVAGPDGRVRFSHLVPGRFTLTAGSTGRRSKPVDVTLEADQARDDVRVVVGGGATVLVNVTGLSPEDRRQLSVMVTGAGSWAPAKELPDGRFEARDVAPGRGQAYARVASTGDPGGRSISRPLTVPEEGTVDVEIPFESGFTLTVRVVRDGKDVEGANVYARPALAEAATPGMGTTDPSGICRLTGLKAGSYSVNVFSFATSGTAPEQKIELTGDRSLEFALPSGRVAGRVVASGTRQPLGDARVSIKSMNADGTFGMTHDATTDDTGRFQLEGLEAGPLKLTAQRRGYVLETRSVTADGPEDLVIELARGDGLDVTGRDGLLGTPLGSLSVRVSDGVGAEVVSTYVRLDSAGRGEIPSLKPGSYSIVAIASGFAPSVHDGVPVPGPALAVALTPGGTLDIDVSADRLKTAPLKCVVNGPRGTPLAFHTWGNRGELSISMASIHLPNFPPVSGTLSCPGSAPIPFAVTEGGTTRIAVK
ncbi:MAG: carboxypeptidase regulatory-like domain-containing protein [Acidobacteria bacterium]|nr:carboxypeptidase regulatory-like domain-containing protein [Acidobacteriota bacterium]